MGSGSQFASGPCLAIHVGPNGGGRIPILEGPTMTPRTSRVAAIIGQHGSVVAQNQIAMFVTLQELNIWRTRSVSGPYRTAGDVSANSPGDWDRIVANKDLFTTSPSTGRWINGPPARTGAGCVAQDFSGNGDPGGNPGGSLGHNWTHRMRDAAFFDLVEGITTHHAAIKTELLWQATQTWAQWQNNPPWCVGVIGDINPSFDIANWLVRQLMAYDFVGRTAFTASELDTLDTWFWHAANFWIQDAINTWNIRWNDRYVGIYTPVQACTNDILPFVGGSGVGIYSQTYNNRRASLVSFPALTAIYLKSHGFTVPAGARSIAVEGAPRGHTLDSIITEGKLMAEEFIRVAVYPEGIVGDMERRTTALPDLGLNYGANTVGSMLLIADALARGGDTSLYDYTTATGLCGSAGTISAAGDPTGSRVGQNKDYRFAIQAFMNYFSDDYARYFPTVDAPTDNNRIDGRDPRLGCSWCATHDTYFTFANMFWKDTAIQTAYLRTRAGTAAYGANPASAGPRALPWIGPNGIFPGTLFMWGNLEGTVNPYLA